MKLTIRMYTMGLGDCFLLRFHPDGAAEPFTMLIDCGIYQGSELMTERLTAVLEHLKADTAGKIDLLLITHEHFDHVAGFIDAFQAFWGAGGISVEQVWMAWTESDAEPYRKLREQRRAGARVLGKILDQLAEQRPPAATDLAEDEPDKRPPRGMPEAIADLLGFAGAPGNPSGPERAMTFVKGLVTQPRFLLPGEAPITLAQLPGVRFYVLGPPLNRKLLDSDPNKGEAYLSDQQLSLLDTISAAFPALFADGAPDGGDMGAAAEGSAGEQANLTDYPFSADLGIMITPAMLKSEAPLEGVWPQWRKDALTFFEERYLAAEGEWRHIHGDWLGVLSDLALNLDSDTNNTSLALAIELVASGQVLIFPGDAQAGNWRSWQECAWKLADDFGHERTIQAAELLERAVFYKVGHHGSHNATLRESGLELMGARFGLTAMLPTDEVFAAGKGAAGWKMPFAPLYKRLLEKTGGRVIRADHGLPRRRNGALALAPAARAGLRAGLDLDDRELDDLLAQITLGASEWERFCQACAEGPAGPRGPLFYELELG